MDFKSLISKLDSMEAPPQTPAAPTLPKSVQLDEDVAMHVLAGTKTLTEAASLMEKKLTAAEKEKKEEVVKSMKKDKGDFKERYGKRGEEVMHATATKIAKKKAESVEGSATDEGISEVFSDSDPVGSKKKTQHGVATKTEKGLRHERGASDTSDDEDDWDEEPKSKKKSKKESIDPEAFKSKFLKMVEAAKKEDKKVKGKKAEEKMDEASKPDFLDIDKDGDKKEPMKKAAADKGGDKKDGKKGMSAKQEKYFGKKVVKESFEQKLTFREMVKLVHESGGQQAIDPLDKDLFAWATRVATNKLGEGTKAEVYAGLVYERMGGRFEIYDVLSENKK